MGKKKREENKPCDKGPVPDSNKGLGTQLSHEDASVHRFEDYV